MNFLVLVNILLFVVVMADADKIRRKADSDVEIYQVEVIEVPWQEQPQQSYGPPSQEPPRQHYGAPKPVYGPPKPVYGPPPEPTTTESETTTTELPTTTDISVNSTGNGTNSTQSARLENSGGVERGVYYIYHPTGALQRVVYATKDDSRNMEYSAQLKYQNVDPVKGPIYTYDPETYLFSRINRK